jgi:hypothetical protein
VDPWDAAWWPEEQAAAAAAAPRGKRGTAGERLPRTAADLQSAFKEDEF